LVDKDIAPIYTSPYRISPNERKFLREEIEKMLNAKIIRISHSPWSSPVLVVGKKDKSKRICLDYRKLNKITQTEKWPIPDTRDIFDRLRDSSCFTLFDLKSGYSQIEIDEESISKTAFSTPDGHYEFLVTPFGLKNAPIVFSRIMNKF